MLSTLNHSGAYTRFKNIATHDELAKTFARASAIAVRPPIL